MVSKWCRARPQEMAPSSSDLEFYYSRAYPFAPVFRWLNGGPEDQPTQNVTHRELAMAFRSGAYKRYVSVNTLAEFAETVRRLNPDRFEVGAVYSRPPKERDSLLKSELVALRKELVFDIDMDDYDSYRTCCQGARVCTRCWRFIQLAIEVIGTALREDFGFSTFVWVFSGRRGAHCWVSDPRAMAMTDQQRRNTLEYLNVVRDRTAAKRLNLVRPYHPLLARSLELLKPHFANLLLEDQDPWRDDTRARATLLTALHDKSLAETLSKQWTEQPGRSSSEKWRDIDTAAASIKFPSTARRQDFHAKLHECKEDIVMATLYPKLDVEVTKLTSHLLKAPFCVHPATGNICVPILDPLTFTPDSAPKLITIQQEWEKDHRARNSLDPFVDAFSKYADDLALADKKRPRSQEEQQ
ncbi:DNA primase subunit PRI1 KNAG_0E03610 [Huiozyma naganishii CBS 8797]|uniref:DNA primase n=1 Tax=Huiozyma naganishii (strain ATCC MYA-139 / BCRC 22969 / CBS 8797 / KCTC 17520 / NBRC 10181 / NCYC 3082 / Yp74L-3) TaxID=1071383 RepID=J7RM51_HUIN7|nr:hypothetical protein KNAG_0E03610 [Kazachstania naganishii CBS 8797]CCK70618.1 hypothetical protein KNAG_0E03610 [Kazachstania naganishii CBS 8797]